MKTPANGLQPNQKIALIQRLFERIYDPKSTVKEIARLVESVPILKNRVLGLVKKRSGGRINVRNCAQAIILIGFNHLSRLAAICLAQLNEQLESLTSGPHRLTPPRDESLATGIAQTLS
ncbi:MAG: HDOD domain-containing protein [Bradymonadia bacterium]